MNARLNELQTQLLKQLKESSAWRNGQHWYQSLPARDQLVVKAVAGLIILALIFVVLYAPLLRSQKQADAALQKNLTTYNLLAENAYRFGSISSGSSSDPLLATVTKAAKSAGVSLSRYEQDGTSLRIWLDKTAFDDAITWLEALQSSQGVVASQINIDRSDKSGVVDIRATLSR